MFIITKDFFFEASHQLNNMPEGHKCARLHGHSYKITFELRSNELNQVGFVRDYGDMDEMKKYIDENYDHRHLNDVYDFLNINPTAEEIAYKLFNIFKQQFPELFAVTVCETEKTSARFEAVQISFSKDSDAILIYKGFAFECLPQFVFPKADSPEYQEVLDMIDNYLNQGGDEEQKTRAAIRLKGMRLISMPLNSRGSDG